MAACRACRSAAEGSHPPPASTRRRASGARAPEDARTAITRERGHACASHPQDASSAVRKCQMTISPDPPISASAQPWKTDGVRSWQAAARDSTRPRPPRASRRRKDGSTSHKSALKLKLSFDVRTLYNRRPVATSCWKTSRVISQGRSGVRASDTLTDFKFPAVNLSAA
jgi:hypothetical protein